MLAVYLSVDVGGIFFFTYSRFSSAAILVASVKSTGPVSKEMIMFVDEMNTTLSSLVCAISLPPGDPKFAWLHFYLRRANYLS